MLIHSLTFMKGFAALLAVLLVGPLALAACSTAPAQHWRDADRSSAGFAPLPAEFPEAVVQVYAGRTFGWQGNFAVHTWIATKEAGAHTYIVHDVTGWGSEVVRRREDIPDRAWYGSPVQLLADIRGERAAAVIERIETTAQDYPFKDRYQAWPGPNSNTFTAWILREVPELEVALPNTAVGKDYLGSDVLAQAPSGTGYQLSPRGYAGVVLAAREGFELNLLGLSIGLDPMALSLKLPGIGSVGLREPWVAR